LQECALNCPQKKLTMNINSLKPAGTLAQKFGVKAMLYGQPGTGKTPMLNTAPRPVLLATEPGLLSMRGSTLPTWEAYTPERIAEFFDWFFKSNEAKNFDTLAIDSGSQLAEIVLSKHQRACKDGRKAFGEMSRECMDYFDQLYFMPQKHVILICKMMQVEVGKQLVKSETGGFVVETVFQSQPFFPGKDLNIKVPHRYDEILYVGRATIPGQPQPVIAIRSKGTDEILARDRTGRLAELEPPDLTSLFNKAMS
jgi:hypothetical protein